MTDANRLLTRKEAAHYLSNVIGLPTKPRTLAKWATVGGGPSYRKAGRRVLYERADLWDWAQKKLGPKQRSSSDVPTSGRLMESME
ncbi:hypothetical protein AB8B21_27860 [Tardiphaga sp. 866_E4_N2_1]|uniref:hypothetical protein n=1 Tax=unclassified Tardiphaga TaxID=2631404 RepID=UPI003F27B616